MLMIRLQRVGRKNDPSFRIVLTDSKNSTKSGKFKEVLGAYDARHGQPILDAVRIKHWIAVGAQATDVVHNILVGQKVIEGKKINVLPKRKPVVQSSGEAKPAGEAPKERIKEGMAEAPASSADSVPSKTLAEAVESSGEAK